MHLMSSVLHDVCGTKLGMTRVVDSDGDGVLSLNMWKDLSHERDSPHDGVSEA